MKICPKCQVPKSVDQFHKTTRSWCTQCCRDYDKARYLGIQADPVRVEQERAKRKAYYERSKEKINANRNKRYAEMSSEERRARRGPYNRSKNRAAMLRRLGVTQEFYDSLLDAQNQTCAICPNTVKDVTKAFAVDHDHRCCPGRKTCGKCVRGLLCETCNRAIGLLHDSVETLESAVKYLKRGKS